MKKNKQYEELYKMSGKTSFPEMYLKEKERRKDIEKRYDLLINLLKEEGYNRVSQKIKDQIESKKLH